MTEIDTLAKLLDSGDPADTALIEPDGTVVTYAELHRQVHQLGDELRAMGLGPSDRIALVVPNGPQLAIAFLAAATTGCAAPLNPQYREDEFRFFVDDLGARVLITSGDDASAVARSAAGSAVHVVLRAKAGQLTLEPERTIADQRDQRPNPDDVALVLHTSGTTSRPKIVPIRQRNLARSAANVATSLRLSAKDRSLNVMPLFHIHGLIASLLAPLSVGASVVCTPGFDAFRFFAMLDTFRPTYYSAVPTMHQMVLARADRHRDEARSSSLRFVRSSSASLPTPVLADVAALFAVPVIESYGMTEATHQMTSNPLPPGITKPGSVGLPTGIELTILDATNRPLPSGARGEVSIKGPTVVDSYEHNPEANAAAFTAGWFRTGDEGYLDSDGYLFITGRLKEQINRGGEKVSPLEVDEALLRHDAVAQAVTFAMAHPKLGEEVGAAVVLVEGASVSETELRAHVFAASLAAFKVPKQVVFLDELPKGATGKLQRIGLAERLGLSPRPEVPQPET